MNQDATQPANEPPENLDSLEANLDEADAADAPETAEQIARRLGNALNDIEGGAGSEGP